MLEMANDSEIGIYIATYNGDFHLARALLASLRQYAPDTPVMIIPGQPFDTHQRFEAPVMKSPGGWWDTLERHNRKLWAFMGPYSKFLYLDADVICLRDLRPLMDKIRAVEGTFLMANEYCSSDRWQSQLHHEDRQIQAKALSWHSLGYGHLESLRQFAPEWKWDQRCPFSSGVYACSRDAFTEEDFRELQEREERFFQDVLGKQFTWTDWSLFFGDQGRLNFLVDMKQTPLIDIGPEGFDAWAEDIAWEISPEVEAKLTFIHYAGVMRPSVSLLARGPLFALSSAIKGETPWRGKRLPAYDRWLEFAKLGGVDVSPAAVLRQTSRDAVHLLKHVKLRLTS